MPKRKAGDMSTKYYAVRAGHKPGIYTSWPECQAQTTGFRGAQFKSFLTEAEAAAFVAGRDVPSAASSSGKKKASGPDKFYAVARGHRPGIYKDWEQAQAAINNSKGAKYKKFATMAEAEDFIRLYGTPDTILSMGLVVDDGEQDEDLDGQRQEEEEDDDDEPAVKKLKTAGVKVVAPAKAPVAGMGDDGVLRIYTDGSSRGNGKVGAIAGLGVYFGDGDPRNIAETLQGEPQTNQRAELTAILRALQVAGSKQDVLIVTDSQYSINCVTVWYKNWVKNGWKTKDGPVKNRDLVEAIRDLIDERDARRVRTEFEWVKGHNSDPGNIAADELAVRGAMMKR